MFKKVTFIFSLYMLTLPCFAIEEIHNGDILTLERCIEIAINNSPAVNRAKANVKVARAGVGLAKSAWTPSIGAGTGFRGSNEWEEHSSHANRYFGVDASISQMIYDFGKTNSDIKINKFNLMAAEYELEYIILETEHAVKEAYLKVLASSANKEIYEEYVEINERQYDQIKAYYDEGIKSRIDFVNAEVNLSDAKFNMLSVEDALCDAMISLSQSMYLIDNPEYSIVPLERFSANGEEKPAILIHKHNSGHEHEEELEHHHEQRLEEISLTGGVKHNDIIGNHILKPYDKTFEETLEIAKQNRPDIKSYLAIKDAMKEELKLTKRSWFPELGANAGYEYGRTHGRDANSISYGVELSIPVFRPVGLKYQIDSAKGRLEAADEDVRMIYQNIYYDVQLAMCEAQVLEKQIPLVLNRVKLAKEEFELADGRYSEGLGNYIELQDARSKYLNAQQEYINTVYEYGLSRAELEFVMGIR